MIFLTDKRKDAEQMSKKISLYILLLAMIMSVLPIQYASAESTGVSSIIGISMDLENPDKEITRGELAQIAISLTKSTLVEDGKAVFIDIPQKHKLFAIVNTVYLNGLMSGYGDSTFRPDSAASVNDAVRMFLNIVGYGTLLRNGNDSITDSECVDIAKRVGILKNVSQGVLTNAKMNRMIDNLSDINMVEIKNITGPFTEYEETSKTYLNNLGYSSASGVVGAVGGASIYGYNTTLNNFITIGEKQYHYSGTDMLEYLGRDVKVILDEDEGEVLGISIRKTTQILEIAAKDIKSYSNYTYEYSVGESRTKKISFGADTRIVFNGVNMEYDKNLMIPNDGKLRFVDSDGNGKYDLLIIYSAVIYRVDSFGDDDTITDKITNGKFNINNKDVSCFKDGAAAGLDGIIKDSFVRIMPDKMDYKTINGALIFIPNANAQNVRLEIISSSAVEGDIQTVSGDSIELQINEKNELVNKEYDYSVHIKKLIEAAMQDAPNAGSKATLYLDENGNIIDMEFSSKYTRANGFKYGYLVSLAAAESGDEAVMVIINESAQKQVFKLNYKFVLNGKKTTIDEQKKLAADKTTNMVLFNADGTVRRQLIGYTLGKDGTPNCIYCAKDYANEFVLDSDGSNTETKNPDYGTVGYMGYDNSNFSLDYSSGKGTTLFRTGVMHLYSFNSDTVAFVVPTDPSRYEKYKVRAENGKSAVTSDNSYPIKIYNVDDEYNVGAFVVDYSAATVNEKRDFNSPSYGGNAQATVITGVNMVWDDDEADTVKKVTGAAFTYQNNITTGQTKDVELSCDDLTLKDTDTVIHGGTKPFGNLSWDEIQEGDVILYRTDNEGKVNAFVIMNRASEMFDSSGNVTCWKGVNNLEATIAVTLSKVVSVNSDGSIIFCCGKDGDYTKYFKGTTNDIMIYNMKTKSYEAVKASELREGDIAFTRSWCGNLREVVVYR